ncbi:MAG: VWA domain-containing protein [Candidatus Pelagadaptatus aseana]|uniref:VWA domain-containing protein n=1 Tax=Candidatus Pelagadaptatus aseana TaxID=3120508 RepID=UPI0039B266B1
MNLLLDNLQYFHFLRPGWLLLLPVVIWLWLQLRALANAADKPPKMMAPHLAEALTAGDDNRQRFRAIDSIALVALLLTLATAGPTWSKVPNPLVAQTAPLVAVLAVTESMTSVDVQPSRLERARQKLLDLSQLRSGARTALVAYAGTSHRVVPLSEDPQVLKPFIEALSVKVMPEPGNNASLALKQAQTILDAETVPGAMVFFLDQINSADLPAFERHVAAEGPKILFVATTNDDNQWKMLNNIDGIDAIRLTADDSDIKEVEARAASAYREAVSRDDSLQWQDEGWLFTWPALLITLLYFRKGWALSLGAPALLACLMFTPSQSYAEGIADWFLTPDQQGRLAYEDARFEEAAQKFQDPLWKGMALYQWGRYDDAVSTLNRLDTSEAAFIQGMANLDGRKYRPAINSFKLALERDPNNQAAARNIEVAEAILIYVEQARLAGDTGTGSEGADEVVYDKEAAGGTEMDPSKVPQKKAKALSTEQWMRSVDSRAEEFLRSRFLLEAARKEP